MGCIVHMYVEKKNPNTGRWDKIGDVFTKDYVIDHIKKIIKRIFGLTEDETNTIVLNYYKGVNPTNKWESYIYDHIKKYTSDDPYFDFWVDDTKFPSPYTDQPYIGQNYNLYGALAGVRNSYMDVISKLKGLPNDVSDEICRLSDDWGLDAHSHNYLTVKELVDSNYYKMTDKDLDDVGIGTYFFREVINSLLELGDPENVRVVFWFDN